MPTDKKKKKGPDDLIREFIIKFSPLKPIKDALKPNLEPREEKSGNVNQNKLLEALKPPKKKSGGK